MIYHALRFRPVSSAEWCALRFMAPTTALPHILTIEVESRYQDLVAAAVTFALTGQRQNDIAEVAIQVSDRAGHTWIVQRKESKIRVLKNGSVLQEEEAEKSFNEAMIDGVATGKSDERLTVSALELLSWNQRYHIIETNRSQQHPIYLQISFNDFVEKKIKNWSSRYNLENTNNYKELTKSLAEVYQQFVALEKQYLSLQAQDQTPGISFNNRDLEHMQVLAKDITFMEELAAIAGPTLHPSFSITKLTEEISALEQQATTLLLPRQWLNTKPDFKEIIKIFCKYKTQDLMVKAMTSVGEACEQEFENALKQYFHFADDFIQDDKQMIPELESCLFALRAPDLKPVERDQYSQKNWFDRLKETTEEELTKGSSDDYAANAYINSARQAIGSAIARLSQVTSRINVAKARHQSVSGIIAEFRDPAAAELKNLEATWKDLASTTGIAADSELNGLFSMIEQYLDNLDLIQRINCKKQELKDAFQRLERAETKLLTFRQERQSQKVVPLSNPVMLLNEIRATLRYLEPKKNKLAQLGEAAAGMKARQQIRDLIKNERRGCAVAWQAALKKAGIEHEIPITASHAAAVAEGAADIAAILGVAESFLPQRSEGNVEELKDIGILSIPKKETLEVDQLLGTLSDYRQNIVTIVITDDRELQSALRQQGAGYSERLVLQPQLATQAEPLKPTLTTKTIATKNPPKLQKATSILDQKARDALSVLTTKR